MHMYLKSKKRIATGLRKKNVHFKSKTKKKQTTIKKKKKWNKTISQ